MPDFKGALQGAGLHASAPQGNRPDRGPQGHPKNQGGAPIFPPGYPQYFTSEGCTRIEMVTTQAAKLARTFEGTGLRRHQLRAFYDHAKRQLVRLAYGTPFEEIRSEIGRLQGFAAYREGRPVNPLPSSFRQFIDLNVAAVVDQKTFQKGFMPHFEAVVAYCARIKD
jgi:CRISPR/Cas system CSM-associated protein Csm2 small subunit